MIRTASVCPHVVRWPPVRPPANKGPVIGLVALITGILIAGGVTYQLTGSKGGASPTANPTTAPTPTGGATPATAPATGPVAATDTAAPDGMIGGLDPTRSKARETPLLAYPPPGYEEASRPLGTPPPNRKPSNAFGFLELQSDGTPIRFDPCRPLHYVIRPDGAPPSGERMLRDAVAAVAQATGLRIVYDGPTDEAPQLQRPSYDPTRYPERWAPYLFAWVQPTAENGLAGELAVSARTSWVSYEGKPNVYVSGLGLLDAPQFAAWVAAPRQTDIARQQLLVAAATMVGLGGTSQLGQVMSDRATVRTTYGPGDLFGLAELGSGPCAPWL